MSFNCGNCGTLLHNKQPFCAQCGRAVDWCIKAPLSTGFTDAQVQRQPHQLQVNQQEHVSTLSDAEVDDILYNHSIVANTYLSDAVRINDAKLENRVNLLMAKHYMNTRGHSKSTGRLCAQLDKMGMGGEETDNIYRFFQHEEHFQIKGSDGISSLVVQYLDSLGALVDAEKQEVCEDDLFKRVQSLVPSPQRATQVISTVDIPYYFDSGYEKIVLYYTLALVRRNMITEGPMQGKVENYYPKYNEEIYIKFASNVLPGLGSFVKNSHPIAHQKILKAFGFLMLG